MLTGRRSFAENRLLKELEDLEASLTDPEIRSSRPALEELLHPDFIELGSSGRVYSRSAIIDTMTAETGTASVVMMDFEVHPVNQETSLATYRSIGQSGDEVRRTSLWLKHEGRWRLRFHQGTRIPNSWGRVS